MRVAIWRRLALGWLAWALVLAPALGLVHQVVHGQLPVAGLHAYVHGGKHEGKGFLAALFAGHQAGDCHLLDQHTNGGPAAFVPTLVLPPWPCALPRTQPGHVAPARWFGFFEARAPPGMRA